MGGRRVLRFFGLSLSKIVIGYEIPLAICVLVGVMILLATKTVRYREMYALIDFRLLVLIACMMSFGVAMENTGADKFLAGLITDNFGQFGSDRGAGRLFCPDRCSDPTDVQSGGGTCRFARRRKGRGTLGLNPRTFIVAVTYAASFSFITPLEPACVLVYTPGRYSFMDFVKVGTILTIIVFAVSIVLVPVFWPL